ncbi:uncharacterized protein LOC142234404 [Haematobia irritans]|uniref:uncharacterized protein LOC142234404 n=1 Tax=Haematobia irritans TaxID=7368 RepID=UPI003F50B4C5
MLKYLLLSALVTIHTVWAKPAPASVHHHGEITPHVVIVTPQAQLQLDTLGHGTPFIQHLSPFTRFVAPHEETIVYVPTSAIGSRSVSSVLAPYQYEARSVSPRQGGTIGETIINAIGNPSLLVEAINSSPLNPTGLASSIANSIQSAAQNSPCDTLNSLATNSPQNWAENIANAAGIQSSLKAEGEQKPQADAKAAPTESSSLAKVQHVEYEIPITPILANEPRHQHQHYASVIGPSVPHVVDYIQTPIFLAPSIPTIKGRSLDLAESKPIIALPIPEPPLPESLPLKPDIESQPISLPEKQKQEEEKIAELGRFLDADDSLKAEKPSEAIEPLPQLPQAEKLEPEKVELKPLPEDNKLEDKPELPETA